MEFNLAMIVPLELMNCDLKVFIVFDCLQIIFRDLDWVTGSTHELHHCFWEYFNEMFSSSSKNVAPTRDFSSSASMKISLTPFTDMVTCEHNDCNCWCRVVVDYKTSSFEEVDELDGIRTVKIEEQELKSKRVENFTCGCFAPIPVWYQRFSKHLEMICSRCHGMWVNETESKKNILLRRRIRKNRKSCS